LLHRGYPDLKADKAVVLHKTACFASFGAMEN
jgi:hypothetical protein